MPNLTIRNIDEATKANLRKSAAEHGRSMEEEARRILKSFLLRQKSKEGIGTRISRRFKAAGGVELPEPSRHSPRGMKEIS